MCDYLKCCTLWCGHWSPLGTGDTDPCRCKAVNGTSRNFAVSGEDPYPTGPLVEYYPFPTLSLTHFTSLKIFVGILPLNVAPFMHYVSRSERMMNMAVLVSTHIPTLNVIWKVFQPS